MVDRGGGPNRVEAAAVTSALVPVTPCRLADTRPAPDGPYGSRRVDATTIRVEAAGRCGVGDAAVAVVLSIVSVGSVVPGFVTVFPTGTDRPLASNLNYRAGETRANSAIVGVGPGASFDVFTTSGELVIDVTGWFSPTVRSASGRFVALTPRRVVDTRVQAAGTGAASGSVAPGGRVMVPLPAGVPSDAQGVSVNLTVTESAGPGFATVYPAGALRPFSSSLNLDRRGQTRAGGVIVPVRSGGLEIYLSGGGHVVVDVNGYVTGPSAQPSDAGLFVPAESSRRLLDTREDGPVLAPGDVRSVSVPSGSATVALNLTSVDGNRGFVTAWPGGSSSRPVVSSLNSEGDGDVVANLALVPAAAAVQLYSQSGTHLVVDLAGWFVGSSAQRPVIALTFDDGPGPFTAAILEVLARHGVSATFFMIGVEVDRRPAVAASVVAAGHRVGSHSYHHPDLTALSVSAARDDLIAASTAIERATGIAPRCMRPPQGRIDRSVEAIVSELGLAIEQGTVDAGDWRDGVTVDEVIGALDAAVGRAGEVPSIMTLHDAGGDRSATVEALDRWLAVQSANVEFTLLSSCA